MAAANAEGFLEFSENQIAKLRKWLHAIFTLEEAKNVKVSDEMREARERGRFAKQFMVASKVWNKEVEDYPLKLRDATVLLDQAHAAFEIKNYAEVDRLTTSSWAISIMTDEHMKLAYDAVFIAALLTNTSLQSLARPKDLPISQELSLSESEYGEEASQWDTMHNASQSLLDLEEETTKLYDMAKEAANRFQTYARTYHFPPKIIEPTRQEISEAMAELTVEPDERPYEIDLEQLKKLLEETFQKANTITDLKERPGYTREGLEQRFDHIKELKSALGRSIKQFNDAQAALKTSLDALVKQKALFIAHKNLVRGKSQESSKPPFSLTQRK